MGKYVNKLNSKQQDSVKDQTNVNNNQLFLNKMSIKQIAHMQSDHCKWLITLSAAHCTRKM